MAIEFKRGRKIDFAKNVQDRLRRDRHLELKISEEVICCS